MNVPLLDVAAAHAELAQPIEDAVLRVLRSGHYVGGPEVDYLEAEWAGFVQARHCIGVGNGLDALTLALRGVGIGAGDEVIVPSNTFIATWLSVVAAGAVPVPVDPIPGDHLLSSASFAAAITPRTRAIVPVHLYGDPVDLDPILTIAARHGIAVVEDAAQAQGATYRGRRIGSHGDAIAWSFYPGQNLGAAGDAGAVTTNHRDVARRVRMLSNYGSEEKYLHLVRGANSRLDPVHAAVLRVKLQRLNEWNQRRARLASVYRSTLPVGIQLSPPVKGSESSNHLAVVRVQHRDRVRELLAGQGVETGVHYPRPPHRQQAFEDYAKRKSWHLPVCDDLAASVLSLPIGPHLLQGQVQEVVSRLEAALLDAETYFPEGRE